MDIICFIEIANVYSHLSNLKIPLDHKAYLFNELNLKIMFIEFSNRNPARYVVYFINIFNGKCKFTYSENLFVSTKNCSKANLK